LGSENSLLKEVREPDAELVPNTGMKGADEPEVGANIDGF